MGAAHRAGLICAAIVALLTVWVRPAVGGDAPVRPNVLWLSSEDNGPHLGAYGDAYADTPSLDGLARKGVRYEVAWSNAPVCAPARHTVITGLYATSTGAEHMRSAARLPEGFRLFPQYLREAGYYTTNNAKQDYNLEGWDLFGEVDGESSEAWDDSSSTAHWRNRPPGAQFFSVFNFGATHESQIRRRPHRSVHDPAAVKLPAYLPDRPEVRRDWAQYYDKLTEMDARAGAILRQLEADGLAGETVVFYWGDHGAGLPRSKRTALDSGLRVPLIVYVPPAFGRLAPPHYVPGGSSDRLVAFVDFAPTVLALAGIEPPPYLQGRAFLGSSPGPAREYLFGFRGRMDERIDLVRTVRDRRWLYARNYMPHRSHGQHVAYMFETPTTKVWHRLWVEGALSPEQARFWQPSKPYEELYDLAGDPDEIHNLAADPAHRVVLSRLREALDRHVEETFDAGFLPEAERLVRRGEGDVWSLARDPRRYDLRRLHGAAKLAARGDAGDAPRLLALLGAADAGLRYWGVVGLLVRGRAWVERGEAQLAGLLDDPSVAVRVTAAETLGRFGPARSLPRCLEVLAAAASLERQPVTAVVAALNALDYLGKSAGPVLEELRALPREHPGVPPAQAGYVPLLLDRILGRFARPPVVR